MSRRNLMTCARAAEYLGYADSAADKAGIHAFRQARVRLGLPTIYLSPSPRDMRFDPVELDAWVDEHNPRKASALRRPRRARAQQRVAPTVDQSFVHVPERSGSAPSGLRELSRETRGADDQAVPA